MDYKEWIQLYKSFEWIQKNSIIIFLENLIPIPYLHNIIKDYVIEPVFIKDLILYHPITVSLVNPNTVDYVGFSCIFKFSQKSPTEIFQCFSCDEYLDPYKEDHSLLHNENLNIQSFFSQKMFQKSFFKVKNPSQIKINKIITYNLENEYNLLTEENTYNFEWQIVECESLS